MRTLVAACFLMVLLISPSIQAQPQPGGPDPGAEKPPGLTLAAVAQSVGLTDVQLKKVKEISIAVQRKIIDLQAKVEMARLDLRELMDSDTPPAEAKVQEMVDRVGKLEAEMMKTQALGLLAIRKAMSLTQWRKLQEVRSISMGR